MLDRLSPFCDLTIPEILEASAMKLGYLFYLVIIQAVDIFIIIEFIESTNYTISQAHRHEPIVN